MTSLIRGVLGISRTNMCLGIGPLRLSSDSFKQIVPIISNQTRSLQLWADWRMKKDVRKRKALEDNYELKIRLNALRRNRLLPPEIQEIATADFRSKLPNDVKMNKIVPRCAITSRPRGNLLRWRLSRIMFRHLADYNKLAGVQRAMW